MPAQARRFETIEQFGAAAGTALGVSRWHRLDQSAIDGFANLTLDRQWIHVDVERALAGPFGAPVAHGFLTLSLIPALLSEVFEIADVGYLINKGVRAVRFPASVLAGSRIRAAVTLLFARSRPRGFWEAVLLVTVERENLPEPACVAELTFLLAAAERDDASRRIVATP